MTYQGPCLKHCYTRYIVIFIIIGIIIGLFIRRYKKKSSSSKIV